ncbi:hypothetical protein HW555_013638 [Spodoptera exigua]|uniref:Uncharacterized protein n=1 Tax=Spodoptera exigua TaxID=7107 RepID=A0A835G2H8_SPOEX|nr:hypothetical protein HW555_013638 [Spodoptera exigua]
MQRPSREQYAAMCARAQATGQPLPAHVFTHVRTPRYCAAPSSTLPHSAGLSPPLSAQVNGKPTNISGRGGRRHVISWMDAPDDLYFRANETAK